MVTCTIPISRECSSYLGVDSAREYWNVYRCWQFLEDWGLFNAQMSFAFEPGCVFSSFGSTQIFVRHSGLNDETLTEGGLEGNFIRQIPESDRNSECHHWVQQRLLRRKYVESNLCFQPRMFRPFTWVARWSKSFPIRFWQTRFWSFLPGFRVGLKGMNLTWMKVSWSACRLADFSAYPMLPKGIISL